MKVEQILNRLSNYLQENEVEVVKNILAKLTETEALQIVNAINKVSILRSSAIFARELVVMIVSASNEVNDMDITKVKDCK